MQVSRLKPIDFGLRVRAHPDSLLITARNKMRDSEEIVHLMSISNEGLESTRLLRDPTVIIGNFKAAQRLVEQVLVTGIAKSTTREYPLWIGVDKVLIVEFLRRFASHPLNLKLQTSALADFIESSNDKKLLKWDISIPSGSESEYALIPGVDVRRRKRKILVEPEKRSLLINAKKMRVGSPADEKAGLSADEVKYAETNFMAAPENAEKTTVPSSAYRKIRTKPLLMLHVLKPVEGDGDGEKDYLLPDGCTLVALGLSFPELELASQSIRYRINLVELRNMLASEVSSDDDLEEEDDGE
jgi:hypothetical protein